MKKSLLFIVLLITLVSITGCTKKENEIAEEIAREDYFFELYNLSIKEYEVEKRQTNKDDKTDLIWMTISGENDDFGYVANYKAIYVKYNDGWLLENVERTNYSYQASSNPEINVVKNSIGSEYDNIKIISETKNTSLNKANYILSAEKIDNFITTEYKIEVEFEFTPELGWNKIEETVSENAEIYDIIGEWIFKDDLHNYYLHISNVEGDQITAQYAFVNRTIDKDDGFWQVKTSAYDTFEITHLDKGSYYVDVGWPKLYKEIQFGDEAVVWLFNHDVTIHGVKNNGICVNNYFLEKINNESNEQDLPEDVRLLSQEYQEDLKNIPDGLFDDQFMECLSYFDKTYPEMKDIVKATGIRGRYALPQTSFLGQKCDAYLWMGNGEYSKPSAIELTDLDYSTEDVRKLLQDKYNLEVYAKSYSSYYMVIPKSGIMIYISSYLDQTKISIEPAERQPSNLIND